MASLYLSKLRSLTPPYPLTSLPLHTFLGLAVELPHLVPFHAALFVIGHFFGGGEGAGSPTKQWKRS